MKKEEYIYRDCTIRLSNRAMADLLYAAIITRTGLPNSYGVGIYEYDRKQNSYNTAQVKVHIHPSRILEFEGIAGVTLEEPIQVQLNC